MSSVPAHSAHEVSRNEDEIVFVGDDGVYFSLKIKDAPSDGMVSLGESIYVYSLSEKSNQLNSGDTISTANPEMESKNEKPNSKYIWCPAGTKLLMETYRELLPQFENKKIKYAKDMYVKIAEVCVAEGYNVTPTQCENRIKHLNRTYKDFNWEQNKTGQGTCFFQCEDVCHELWAKKHNVTPPVVLSSSNGITINISSSKDADLSENEVNEPGAKSLQSNEDLANTLISNEEEQERAIENAIAGEQHVPPKKVKKNPKPSKSVQQLEACLTSINKIVSSLQERKTEREAVNKHIISCCKADEKLKNLQYAILKQQLQSNSTFGTEDQSTSSDVL